MMTPTTQLYSDRIASISKDVTDVFVINTEGKVQEKMFRTIDPARDLSNLVIWVTKMVSSIKIELPQAKHAVLHYQDRKLLLIFRDGQTVGVILARRASEGPMLESIYQTLGWLESEPKPLPSESAKKKTPFIMDLGGGSRAPFGTSSPTASAAPQSASTAEIKPASAAPVASMVPAKPVAEPVTEAKSEKKGAPVALIAVGVIALIAIAAVAFLLVGKKPEPIPVANEAFGQPQPAAVTPLSTSVNSAPAAETVIENISVAEQIEKARAQVADLRKLVTDEKLEPAAPEAMALAKVALAATERLSTSANDAAAVTAWEAAAESMGNAAVAALNNQLNQIVASITVDNPTTYRSANLDALEKARAESATAIRAKDYSAAILSLQDGKSAAVAWKNDIANQLLAMGRAAAVNKEVATGKVFFLQLLKLDPNNEEALSYLHRNFYRSGQIITNGVSMRLAFVPPGEIRMGSPSTEVGRDPDETQFTVIITKGLFFGTTEVTQEQWSKVMGDPIRKVAADPNQASGFIGQSIPMHGVTHAEAVEFCERLSAMEGKKYRLPTEAEWEYACRAGTTTPFANGSESIGPQEVNYYNPAAPRESPVVAGSLRFKNGFGLSDMHGNLWEWVADWYSSYPEGVFTDYRGPSDKQIGRPDLAMKVARGGSWNDDMLIARSANRAQFSPVVPANYIGIRVVMEVNEFKE